MTEVLVPEPSSAPILHSSQNENVTARERISIPLDFREQVFGAKAAITRLETAWLFASTPKAMHIRAVDQLDGLIEDLCVLRAEARRLG